LFINVTLWSAYMKKEEKWVLGLNKIGAMIQVVITGVY
jgi:hypothetical protein